MIPLRRFTSRIALLTALAIAALLPLAGPAVAAEVEAQKPQWTISSVSIPTNFPPNDSSGQSLYRVVLTNSGGKASSGTITVVDALPAGLTLHGANASGVDQLSGASLSCAGLSCTYPGAVAPNDSLLLTIPVNTGAEASVTNLVKVTGGGAAEATQSTPTEISSTPAHFGIAPGSARTALSSLQAGAHADLTTTVAFNTINHEGSLAGDPKDTTDNLPPGFAGDLTDMPACAVAYFSAHNECPVSTQVGTVTVTIAINHLIESLTTPVYNLAPNPGTTAKLAFYLVVFNVQGDVSVRPGDEGLETTFHNTNESSAEVDGVSLTIWGVPGAESHNAMRGTYCGQPGNCKHVGGSPSGAVSPFLSLPTSCTGDVLEAEFQVDSWQQPREKVKKEMPFGPLTGCEHLLMQPSMTAEPTTDFAYSATGLDVGLEVPQTYENPFGLATPHLKKAVVTLPEGMSLNPSAGAGLGYCTEAQLASETAESLQGEGCPNDSKVGTVRIKTPSLPEEATGDLYVAQPFANRFGSLLALYIVAKIPDRGIIVRAEGEVHADPLTGQLTTTFDENPQLPFSDFTLSFRQGATSPLITPPACGEFTASGLLNPWSDPLASAPVSASFTIHHGVHGGECPRGGVPPFHPLLRAGSYSNQAGAYSPFYIRLSREDGEQEITHFSIKLPPGLIGKLAGIPFCSDIAIEAAKARTGHNGGQEELEHPSCPAASEVGRTEVEAGVGSVLASAPGKVYLAGPYRGAPISVVAITAAKVGPFDLGTVVVREGLRVNPETGEVFVDATGSDPLPHIVDGIPTHLRNIRVYMDRPEFVLSPTSCEPTSTASTVLGSGKDFVSEADDNPITVTSPFQAADCASLAFKPKLALSLKGGMKRGATPAFKAVLTYPKNALGHYANIAQAQVTLPHSEFLEQAHIGTVCTRVQFAAGAGNGSQCPAASVYGFAKAITPILSTPLEGPVYLRSSSHNLPDLVAALHNNEINIDLDGRIDSVKGGRIRNTFESVPDAPVSSFTLEMDGGKKGLLVNSTNICKAPNRNRAIAHFVGQNGKVDNYKPVLRAKCRGKHKKKGKAHKRSGAHR